MQEISRRVGRYEILRVIGRGGAAVVYLARQLDLERDVALKELSAFHATDPTWGKRFLAESRMAGSLTHPNIVTVHDYFVDKEMPYIAMEFMERGSLRPFVGHLTLPRFGIVLESLLAGLALPHSRGIVHRDLKPENLMVSGDGGVKIADFGIAKALHEPTTLRTLTATGMTVGTPAYMAPEQAMAKEIGPWTDLYATGVIAYELLAGRVPFHDTETPWAVLHSQIYDPPPPLRELDPELDPRLVVWVESLLAKDPRDRPRAATETWHDLEDILVGILGPLWRRNARLPAEPPPGEPMTASRMTRVDQAAQEAAVDEPEPEEDVTEAGVTVASSPIVPEPVTAPPPQPEPAPVPEPEPAPAPEPAALAATEVAAPVPAEAAPPPPPPPVPEAPTGASFEFPATAGLQRVRRRVRPVWILVVLALGAAAVAAVVVLLTGGGSKKTGTNTSAGHTTLLPDPAPKPLERASLAASGDSVFVASPRGRIVKLAGDKLGLQAAASDPAGPLGLAVADGALYVLDKETLTARRLGDLTPLDSVPFPGSSLLAGGAPAPVVVASRNGRVCLARSGKLGSCGKVPFAPAGLGVSETEAVYVADSAGSKVVPLVRVGDKLVARAPIALPARARPHGTLLVFGGRLYVPIARGIAVVDPAQRKLEKTIRLPTTPQSIWIVTSSGRLFGALYASNRVAFRDVAAAGAPTLVRAGGGPVSVAASAVPSGGRNVVYALNGTDGTITRLDAATGLPLGTAKVRALGGPRVRTLVARSIDIRSRGRTVTATIRFAGGTFDHGTVAVRDAAITDGKASLVLWQGGISTAVRSRAGDGITIDLAPAPGRLVVAVSAAAGTFSDFRIRTGAGGRRLSIVVTKVPPKQTTTTVQTSTFHPTSTPIFTPPPPPPTTPRGTTTSAH